MGTQKTTTTNTIPGAGSMESGVRDMMMRLIESSSGQINLAELAQGNIGGPTESDLALISNTLGRTRDITSRNLASLSQEGQGRLSEQLASRGIGGGSNEGIERMMLERDLLRRSDDLLDRSRIESNQALMQLPFQRAQVQLGANQTLLQGLLGAANPLLANLQQDRLSQQTTTQETPFSPAQAIQMGGALAGAIPTGGLSLLGMPGATGGGPVNPASVPRSTYGEFSSGLRVGSRR